MSLSKEEEENDAKSTKIDTKILTMYLVSKKDVIIFLAKFFLGVTRFRVILTTRGAGLALSGLGYAAFRPELIRYR
jgi:hypothetical protein